MPPLHCITGILVGELCENILHSHIFCNNSQLQHIHMKFYCIYCQIKAASTQISPASDENLLTCQHKSHIQKVGVCGFKSA